MNTSYIYIWYASPPKKKYIYIYIINTFHIVSEMMLQFMGLGSTKGQAEQANKPNMPFIQGRIQDPRFSGTLPRKSWMRAEA